MITPTTSPAAPFEPPTTNSPNARTIFPSKFAPSVKIKRVELTFTATRIIVVTKSIVGKIEKSVAFRV